MGRTLVTGALGCIGAWTLKALLDDGEEPVGYDLGGTPDRVRLVAGEEALARVTLVQGDVTDGEALGRALDEHGITHVVHLAGLQVPFCRADPALGAHVNVRGTIAVFEAVKARRERIPGLAYASSAAVYGPDDPDPAPESGGRAPRTHYGVFKLANEGTARIYWQDDGLPSIGMRPYVVYGVARDQGMTSGPTAAVLAAVRGEPYEIAFTGRAQYDLAADVGRAFADASRAAAADGFEGAHVANFPGVPASVDEVIAAIERVVPEAAGTISATGAALPFPEELDARILDGLVGPVPRTSLEEGVRRTVEHFRAAAP